MFIRNDICYNISSSFVFYIEMDFQRCGLERYKMLTYEELQPVLYRIAYMFANYKYDVNELINAVWVIGNVQKLPDIRLAYKRIYYDMIIYIRTQEGRKKQSYSQKPSTKYRAYTTSYNAETEFADNYEHSTYEMFMGKEDGGFAKVDFKDELESFMKRVCNNCEDRLIVKMRLDGYTLREIGKVVGVVESRISQILTNIGERLLANITSSGIAYNKKVIKELCKKGINNGKESS